MTSMFFKFFEVTPFVLFLKLISCPLCYSDILRNILIVFGSNVEQDKTTCREQE